jgi:intein-encoded DNA endonuclease-like protein
MNCSLTIQVIDLYINQKLNCKQISKIVNKSFSTIERILHKNNIKIDRYRNRRFINKNLNEQFFKYYNEQSVYFAGLIAADGNIYLPKNYPKSQKRLTIELCDKEILEKFQIGVNVIKSTTKNTHYINVTSTEICDDLYINFNITERKTFTLKFPTQIPDNLKHHFIRGYFDGDGCFYISKKGYLKACMIGNIQFIIELQKNIPCKSKIIYFVDKDYCELVISQKREEVIKFVKLIYNNSSIFLNRKKIKSDIFLLQHNQL